LAMLPAFRSVVVLKFPRNPRHPPHIKLCRPLSAVRASPSFAGRKPRPLRRARAPIMFPLLLDKMR
jgi:hypothetical protein